MYLLVYFLHILQCTMALVKGGVHEFEIGLADGVHSCYAYCQLT